MEWLVVFRRTSMSNFLMHAKESGLSMPQLGAMVQIHRKAMRGVSEIGDDLGITGGAASQLIDRLVQQGLVSRTEDPQDRRVKHIDLTDKGLQILHAGRPAPAQWLEDLGALLTPAEREQVIAAMRLLIDKAGQLEHPDQPD
jgi:DNA-binding MarR family transcriptional regulator